MVSALRGYYFCIANFLCLSIHVLHSQTLFKSATFTPSNTNINGSYMLTHVKEVNLVNNKQQWRVRTNVQSAWHFIIVLDGSWGFDPNERSAITFIVDSPTIARPHTFNDLLFGFTMDNKEYLSMFIPMDSNGGINQIYPGCDTKALPTQTFAVGDIASLPDYDRDCDVAGGSCSNWRDMFPPNHKQYNRFPIRITLENDPKSNIFSVSFISDNEFEQKCGFVPVKPNQGIKMYLGGNEQGEQFLINSFGITYEAFPPTAQPTNAPTFVPTLKPTNIPSSSPSYVPTALPTLNPSNVVTPLPYPMQFTISCGDVITDVMHTVPTKLFPLNIPYDVQTLTISLCEGPTSFNTTLHLFDEGENLIAFDSDGCGDVIGRSLLVIDDVSSGVYPLLISSVYADVEGPYKVSVSCSISTEMFQFCSMFVGL